MHSDGDAFLQAFTLDKGNNWIEDEYYSFGTYLCGSHSCSQKHNNGTKKATPNEVYDHGQWQHCIVKESMPI